MAGKPKQTESEVVAINESEGPVVVKLAIPAELYLEYKSLADAQDLTPAELILHRLQRCSGHSSIRSLYFSTSQLSQLEALLQKRPISTSEQALALLTSALSVRIGDFPPVPISAQQAKRLEMGAYGGLNTYERLCQIVGGAIAKATGI